MFWGSCFRCDNRSNVELLIYYRLLKGLRIIRSRASLSGNHSYALSFFTEPVFLDKGIIKVPVC